MCVFKCDYETGRITGPPCNRCMKETHLVVALRKQIFDFTTLTNTS